MVLVSSDASDDVEDEMRVGMTELSETSKFKLPMVFVRLEASTTLKTR
jgi:hypothetical protein